MNPTTQMNTGLFYESLRNEQEEIQQLLTNLETETQTLSMTAPVGSEKLRKLKELFQDFEIQSNTHFACEEYGLFPVLKKHHPMILMEKEHDLMMELREAVKKAIESIQDNPTEISELKEKTRRLASEMRRHFEQESRGIYRIAERDLSPQEKEQVSRTMYELRSKAGSGLIYAIQRPEKHFFSFKSDLGRPLSKSISSKKLLEHPTADIKQISIRSGETLAEQWSPNRTIVICQQGKAECRLKEEMLALEPGSGVLIEAGLTPVYHALSDCDLLFIIERSDQSA